MSKAGKIDLHTHSTASDGTLSPFELLGEALQRNIEMLSITDHDCIDAYRELSQLDHPELKLVPGIEFSTLWGNTGIHIVGLDINLDCEGLNRSIARQREVRQLRGRHIAERLEKAGINGVWEGVQKIAGNSVMGRPHFSEYLVENGIVKNPKEAFEKYLGAGRAGDIKHLWLPMPELVDSIIQAGGIAVLAHPAKYKLTNSKLSRLLDAFIEAGGRAMEVISGNQPAHITAKLARLCRQKDLYASSGSDFHRPHQRWSDLGNTPPLPASCAPVWEYWN